MDKNFNQEMNELNQGEKGVDQMHYDTNASVNVVYVPRLKSYLEVICFLLEGELQLDLY